MSLLNHVLFIKHPVDTNMKTVILMYVFMLLVVLFNNLTCQLLFIEIYF